MWGIFRGFDRHICRLKIRQPSMLQSLSLLIVDILNNDCIISMSKFDLSCHLWEGIMKCGVILCSQDKFLIQLHNLDYIVHQIFVKPIANLVLRLDYLM